jgi:hypothetical protein
MIDQWIGPLCAIGSRPKALPHSAANIFRQGGKKSPAVDQGTVRALHAKMRLLNSLKWIKVKIDYRKR